jgi:translocation protein SEC63
MLGKCPELVDGLIHTAYTRKWLETTISAIKFAQCVVQGLWYTNHSMVQLPHIPEAEVKALVKKAKTPTKCLWEYLRTPDSEKKGLDGLSEAQKQDVYRTCNLFPKLKVETDLFVEEEEKWGDDDETANTSTEAKTDEEDLGKKIFEQDLVTLRVTLTRENVTKGGRAAPVYAPNFPKTIREGWWIILTESSKELRKGKTEPDIHAVEKISDQTREMVHELRFMAPPRAGTYQMELQVLSDCYVGLDEHIEVEFEVHPADELPEYKPHPEDLELDNEPTLFEQLMAANMDDSSDDEDDEPKVNNGDSMVDSLKKGADKESAVVEELDSDEESEED